MLEARPQSRALRGALTPAGDLALMLRKLAAEARQDDGHIVWPSSRWADDPVGFAVDVLGVKPWAGQIEILESIRDNRNTTVRSGHKCGKSTALACAALWFYCSFDRARVLITAVTSGQVNEVIWKEVQRLHRGAKHKIDGRMYTMASRGLRGSQDRQIWGITARESEGMAGISGPNVLVLVDEASGVPDSFFEVLGSSLAGSGGMVRKCYISNPTRTFGEFYKSHTTSAHVFNCIHLSSEDTPNARGEEIIPGLAGPEWIEEKRLEYGEDSPMYKIRVRGEFVQGEDGKIISAELLANAEDRWETAEAEGRLWIGIDPAGPGTGGDESAFAVRRGKKVLKVYTRRALTPEGHLAELRGLIAMHAKDRELPPVVVLDREGPVGWEVFSALNSLSYGVKQEFVLVSVLASKRPERRPDIYVSARDELWANAAAWFQDGAIPTDTKLNAELHFPSWGASDRGNLIKVTRKDKFREALNRSPDRADAVLLSLWEPPSLEKGELPSVGAMPPSPPPQRGPINPYSRDRNRMISPYGGRR